MRRLVLLLGALGACKNDTQIAVIEGELAASPDLVDVGDLVVGDQTDATIHLVHTSGQALTVLSSELQNLEGDFFSFDDAQLPIDLPIDGAIDLHARYAPTAPGWHRARLTLVNNGYQTQVGIDVRAHAVLGVANVYPRLLDFGEVDAGQDHSLALTVVNEGSSPLTVLGANFDVAGFHAEDAFPLDLPVGESFDLTVVYASDAGDGVHGALTLDLGAYVSIADVTVVVNDCENGVPSAYDVDKDGFTSCTGDCDDGDHDVNPGAIEGNFGDGVDDDCDGKIDQGTDRYDDDGDGTTEQTGDCNDADPAVNTAVVEDCDNAKGACENGIDDNCDGQIDYGSADGDFDGYAEGGSDCDDADATRHPGAPELPDGKDNDCDGLVDEGTTNSDDDGDGKTEAQGDCDDTDPAVAPGKAEVPDFKDNNCDARIDEGTPNADDDGDGFSEVGGDCNDASNAISPGRREIAGNGVDEDCDPLTGP